MQEACQGVRHAHQAAGRPDAQGASQPESQRPSCGSSYSNPTGCSLRATQGPLKDHHLAWCKTAGELKKRAADRPTGRAAAGTQASQVDRRKS